MQNKLSNFLIIVLTLTTSICYSQNKPNSQKSVAFFSIADSANWVYMLNNSTLQPSQVFKMGKGLLKISPAVGYIRTKKEYSNYQLALQWRWIDKLGNSGVLLHIQPKDTIWPVCYQVQQRADYAGDIICMNGLKAKECSDTVKFTIKKQFQSNEKPLGKWNTMEIQSIDGKISVYINKLLQNTFTAMNVKTGFIGFQAEGVAMEFRHLKIK